MKRSSSRSGTSAVEMALVAPLVLLLTAAVLELGWQMCVSAALDYGARRAARVGITGAAVGNGPAGSDAQRQAAIRTVVLAATGGLLVDARLTLGTASYASVAAASSAAPGISSPGGASQVVRYTLRYAQPLLTGSLAASVLNRTQFIHNSTLVVVNEPFPTN